MAKLILADDFKEEKPKYLELIATPFGDFRSILHLAAERNLVEIMKFIIEKDKNSLYQKSIHDSYFPLHYALKENHDEAASLLIQQMSSVR